MDCTAAVNMDDATWPEALRRQADRLQTLNEISRVVSATLDLLTLYDTIYEQVGRVMDTAQFFIALHRPERSVLEISYYREEGRIYPPEDFPFGNNVTSLVIDRGTPLLFDTGDEYIDFVSANGLPQASIGSEVSEACIFVPLNTGSRTLGAMTVQSMRQYAYTQDDVETLSVIASQAAIAIENARLFNEQQRRVFELQTIQSIVQQLTPLHDIPSIVALINEELKRLIEYHSCRLFVLDPGEQTLLPLGGGDPAGHTLVVKVGEGITGWIAMHNSSVIIPNALEDPRASHIADTPRREESMIGVPLVYEERVQGVITLSKLGVNQFDEGDIRLLEIIAGQAAIAFDRVRLYEELRTEAVTDPMTGLYNRRYLFERFKEEQARAVRHTHVLAAIILDIDKFKSVNDRYGHAAGDLVLQELAALIRQVVRTEDIVARYGGEEFCILLPEIPLADAEQVAERLRIYIEEHDLPEAAGVKRVTASVGMALYSPGDRETDLFTRADLAMYAVKHRGGNLLCIAEGETFRFV